MEQSVLYLYEDDLADRDVDEMRNIEVRIVAKASVYEDLYAELNERAGRAFALYCDTQAKFLRELAKEMQTIAKKLRNEQATVQHLITKRQEQETIGRTHD